MEMTPYQYDNMKSEIVAAMKTVYLQGLNDGKENNPGFEDGFNCDAGMLIEGILENYIEVIG